MMQANTATAQIYLWTVAKEMGHKTVARVADTYGHPSHFRPRGEVVEYQVEKHWAQLGQGLTALAAAL